MKHLIVAVVFLCLAGCGGSDHSTPEATVRSFYAAARAGDREAFLACFSERTRTFAIAVAHAREEQDRGRPSTGPRSGHIEEIMAGLKKKTGGAKLKFSTTQTTGNKAVVEVSIGERVVLIKEGSSWEIDLE